MNSTIFWAAGIGFLLLTIIYFGMLLSALFKASAKAFSSVEKQQQFKRNWIVGLLVWAVFVTVWSGTTMMSDFSIFPLNFLPVLLIPFVVIITVTYSGALKAVLVHVPEHHIIRLQSFRFFVELLLWLLFVGNLLPEQMSFEGRNFDILAGITSIGMTWLVVRGKASRGLIIAWNIVCLALLINIVSIALLSTPTPLRYFMNDPANTVVAYFPVSFLPAFLVPLAYMLHFFSLRQLALKSRSVPATSAA